MSKIMFLFDPQPEECCQYVLKSLVNLSLSVLIKKGSYKKEYNIRSFSLIFFLVCLLLISTLAVSCSRPYYIKTWN